MVERVHFEKKYGNTPKDWVANISKEALAGKEKEIRKQVLDEIRSGKRLKDETPDRISSIAGGAKGDEGKLKEEAPASLQSLFSV